MRTREEVPKGTRPRYVITVMDYTERLHEPGQIVTRTTRTFYVVDLHDKARCVWKVTGGHPSSSKTRAARLRAEQIARKMNSSYERGLRAAEIVR